ncbi:hypothetical protein H6P81_006921 [Aristolochia fimbriata]|uniref:UDP-glycosyltransferases domain-containing protein n=1 Tax=Aristolochia fimbriata TaxID=158543 RepID=A0AAV7F244_ARIFI|nr:hypothetical protein H6P81_006921 [Aristolochia fimbriata]
MELDGEMTTMSMAADEGGKLIEDDCIVLYPYPSMGHLISMVELGKRFLDLSTDDVGGCFTVVVIVAEAPFVLPYVDVYIKTVTESHPSIVFRRLPPHPSLTADNYYPPTVRTIEMGFEFMRASNPLLRLSLQSISLLARVRGLFVDFFGAAAMDVADELGIPPYTFMTSAAAQLAFFLYFPTMHNNTGDSFKDLERSTLLEFPGLPPLQAADIPQGLEDRNKKAYGQFLEMSKRIARAAGFVVNTFDSLEPRALTALENGACLPDGAPTPPPPCYAIGPLVAPDKGDRGARYCLKWLDSQPRRSVVLLSFGSMGVFSTEQLREIATGLERSGHRFLWVLRSNDNNAADLDALLPEGFMDRTRGRGLVWKSWTEQAAVLNRDSVGAFVTHCGWNSVLESICAGVPMVAWPLYAEQRMIRVLVEEEMKLGVAVEFDEKGKVSAAELEKRVREVMDCSEEGKGMRERAETMKAHAAAAFGEGGPSHTALLHLAKKLKQGCLRENTSRTEVLSLSKRRSENPFTEKKLDAQKLSQTREVQQLAVRRSTVQPEQLYTFADNVTSRNTRNTNTSVRPTKATPDRAHSFPELKLRRSRQKPKLRQFTRRSNQRKPRRVNSHSLIQNTPCNTNYSKVIENFSRSRLFADRRIFGETDLARPVGHFLPLISFSVQQKKVPNLSHGQQRQQRQQQQQQQRGQANCLLELCSAAPRRDRKLNRRSSRTIGRPPRSYLSTTGHSPNYKGLGQEFVHWRVSFNSRCTSSECSLPTTGYRGLYQNGRHTGQNDPGSK